MQTAMKRNSWSTLTVSPVNALNAESRKGGTVLKRSHWDGACSSVSHSTAPRPVKKDIGNMMDIGMHVAAVLSLSLKHLVDCCSVDHSICDSACNVNH
jgi:hypothetical protein